MRIAFQIHDQSPYGISQPRPRGRPHNPYNQTPILEFELKSRPADADRNLAYLQREGSAGYPSPSRDRKVLEPQ